jgi:short-subunit dehydrogenase
MKNICVITGASSGIGKEFFAQITADAQLKFDEFWVIARNEGRLKALEADCPVPLKVVALDLSSEESFGIYRSLLEEERPNIALLVHCSGFGKFESVEKVGYDANLNMIDLNVRSTVALNLISLEFMSKGSGIVNVASVAAYQPIPYIATYGATKSFVLNFTRALSVEQKPKGIRVMAVCPFWTKTEFFDRAIKPDEDAVVKKYIAMYEPSQIVGRALSDYKKGKSVSLFGFKTKMQLLAVKLAPVPMVMKIWMGQQKLKNRD